VTGCENAELINAISANAIELNNGQASYIAIYLTAIFAYIVAAYSAGKNLTRFQVVISNTLFCIFAFVIVSRIVGLGVGMNILTEELAKLGGRIDANQFQIVDRSLRLWVSSILWTSGVLFALAFMWSVRHPRTE
jgi:type IV secretory pathway TrbD component